MARYLLAHPRFVRTCCRGVASEVLELVVWSDSDWAGCRASRKSMSGGILAIGGGIVKTWSNRQASIALSSGEAEFYAAGKAATEALEAKSLLRALGLESLADTQYRRGGSTGNCSEAGRRENPALGGPLPLTPGRCAEWDHLFVESLGEDESC